MKLYDIKCVICGHEEEWLANTDELLPACNLCMQETEIIISFAHSIFKRSAVGNKQSETFLKKTERWRQSNE